MKPLTVGLDVDSTLAATLLQAAERIDGPDHNLSYTDFLEWDWPCNYWGQDRFLTAVWDSWRETPLSVAPLEKDIYGSVKALYDSPQVDYIDIVTAQEDDDTITEGKLRWMEHHGLTDFTDTIIGVPMNESKADLGYDVLIDDKPSLVAAVAGTDTWLFLRDHVYNRGLEGDYIRVHSVAEAAEKLGDPYEYSE